MAKKQLAKTQRSQKKPLATFEVKLVGPDVLPERIPLRVVSDALSAVQDIASGRDSFEEQHVSPEKSINLLDVGRGSATYRCVARAPEDAITNLTKFGSLLSSLTQKQNNGDGLVAALRPIETLSEIARSVGGRVQVTITGDTRTPAFSVEQNDYRRISENLFVTGETTIVGTVERAGGATEMRCLLRVPGRRRILYCDVKDQALARRLGQHLYEEIAATGTATWIHRTWRIHAFTINDFTQPRLGDVSEAIEDLRGAGLAAWDEVDNPEQYLRELR